MNGDSSTTHANISVVQWNNVDKWLPAEKISIKDLYTENPTEAPKIIAPSTQVFMVIAHTPKDREKEQQKYREEFVDTFFMSKLWCLDHLKNANGYFGCEATRNEGSVTGFNTWSFFEVKHVPEDRTKYYWSKINISTRWLSSTNQMGIFLFDPTDKVLDPLLHPDQRQLNDPFWIYTGVLQEVARLQEIAVWEIRHHVRNIEKEAEKEAKAREEEKRINPNSLGKRPKPDYRRLHDIARHAIHVTETLDVAVQNVDHIIRQHEMYMHTRRDQYAPNTPQDVSFEDISSRLSFFQSHIESIRHRSISNHKRLQNEIQLKFNEVAQYDAGLTVEISRAARSDSATMKTLAFVTLTFLPPTFICALFSMSFFNYDRDTGWAVSDKLWIYWVFAVPTTIATALLWQYWSKLFPRYVLHMHGNEAQEYDHEEPKEKLEV
ncbi:hypothetical protein N7454_003492 [Penicillium verhagenii]|nr:hypothetical protein N7454_003492 [Penicillium verhagenii]